MIQIFDPSIDPGSGIDVPCTLSYRFLARRGKLHMFVTMRSQDVWLGLPYDIFSSTVIMEVLANWLGVSVGECTVSIDSFHLYDRDIAKAASTSGRIPDDREALRALSTSPSDLTLTIEQLLTGPAGLSDGWEDAARILASHRLARTDIRAAIALAQTVPGPMGEAASDFYRLRSDPS